MGQWPLIGKYWWYRVIMRVMHRFNLCYLRPLPVIDDKIRHRCDWCGASKSMSTRPVLTIE